MDEEKLVDELGRIGIHVAARRGNNLMCRCPAGTHADRRPSWGISVNDPHLHGCFGCGFRGNLLTLLMQVGGMSFDRARLTAGMSAQIVNAAELREALEWSEKKYGNKALTFSTDELLPFYSSKRSETYMQLRGISLKTIRRCQILFDPKLNRVLFPWFIEDQLYAITGRALSAKEAAEGTKIISYLAGSQKREVIYLPGRKILPEPLIVVEGEGDSLKIFEAGFENVAALGQGRVSEGALNLMLNSPCTKLWIFTDRDEAGTRLARDLEKAASGRKMVYHIGYEKVADEYAPEKKLDPGMLTTEELKRVLVSGAGSLFPRWKKMTA